VDGGAGPEVVDEVERRGRGIEQAGVGAAEPAGQPPEDGHHGQQRPHDEVAEQHVEQQLLVGPPGPAGAPGQAGGGRLAEQAVEVGLDPVELVMDRLPVPGLRLCHAPASISRESRVFALTTVIRVMSGSARTRGDAGDADWPLTGCAALNSEFWPTVGAPLAAQVLGKTRRSA
jgi:hypothetical protein